MFTLCLFVNKNGLLSNNVTVWRGTGRPQCFQTPPMFTKVHLGLSELLFRSQIDRSIDLKSDGDPWSFFPRFFRRWSVCTLERSPVASANTSITLDYPLQRNRDAHRFRAFFRWWLVAKKPLIGSRLLLQWNPTALRLARFSYTYRPKPGNILPTATAPLTVCQTITSFCTS